MPISDLIMSNGNMRDTYNCVLSELCRVFNTHFTDYVLGFLSFIND